jgi:hypothetical protein
LPAPASTSTLLSPGKPFVLPPPGKTPEPPKTPLPLARTRSSTQVSSA